MKDSLNWFLDKFPVFLNKEESSNFYKSSTVLNTNFKDIYNDLFKTHLGHRLQKRVLIWKEQSVESSYTINFFVNVPYLKTVTCYKNDSAIYSESYSYTDEADTFIYSYDDSSQTIISDDKYYIAVETWEEYSLQKGFPENDVLKGDMYDHDQSLDDFGALYDIPRKQYVYPEGINYGNTEPPYNNRLTEDDYHYMNRILTYISHLQDTPLPVLEVWKLFGIDLSKITLINRERYLCKMYSSVKHNGDDWTPQEWEHKDPMSCFWPEPLFFFVEVDNHSPILGQDIQFTFTFMDMFGEDKGKDYLIDVYLNGTLIDEDVDPSKAYIYDTTDSEDDELIFQFIANPIDPKMETLESDEIIITIKGCNTADWYVAEDGDDSNDGTSESPFATLPKALSMVEGSNNVVVLKEGTFFIDEMQTIDTATSIISCRGAVIRNEESYDFFQILQDCNLYMQGITLKHRCCEMQAVADDFYNYNKTQNPIFLRINPDLMCKPPVVVRVDSMTSPVYAHSTFTVEGTLLNEQTMEAIEDETVNLLSGATVIDSDTTGNNGEYELSTEVTTLGSHSYKIEHQESSKFCMGSTDFSINVEAMPTILTATISPTVMAGDTLTIGYDLEDYYGNDITAGTISLIEDGTVVATITPGGTFNYTPTVGTHTYKLSWEADSTYVASETETVTVTVRKYVTLLTLDSAKSVYNQGETVTVTGTLTDEASHKLANQTVKLYDGSTLVYTGTTNSNGVVTYSSTFSVGNHTLQWKFDETSTYEAADSNKYNIRVKSTTPNPINLFLYPDKKIGVTGTTIGLNVLALDANGDPIANTSFKLIDTYSGQCGVLSGSTYTTDSNGWWSGNLTSNAITNCHGIYVQAVSTTNSDYYSNVAHIFDAADPLLDVEASIYTSISVFDKDTSSIPVSVLLMDEENDPVPGETFTIQLIQNGTVKATSTGTTNCLGEADVNVSVPSSVLGNDLTVKVVYNGRANAYNGGAYDTTTLTYIFSPEITLTSTRKAYPLGDNAVINGVITDEFGTVLSNKQLKLYNGTTLLDTDTSDSNGEVSLSSSSLLTGATTFKVTYTGSGVYHDAESTITVNACEFVAEVNGNSITIGDNTNIPLVTTADVFIDWGDGTSETLNNRKSVTHTYTDGESSHEIVFCGTITSVGNNAFREITGLTGITIPDSVTILGNTCFYGCSGLTSVIIPDSVTSIGTSCFYGCSGLTSVTISDSITSLGNSCFADCSGLTSVIIPDSVTSLGQSCFYGCTSLTDITIPDNVTSLGASCFSHCSGLTSVTISDSVTTLGNNCFYNCSNLMEYKLYWTSSPVAYSSSKMPTGADTVFKIPAGTSATYTSASYPSTKLVERDPVLTVTGDKNIIQSSQTATVTAVLTRDSALWSGATLSYEIKHGATTISSGSGTTDSNGEMTIQYTGTGAGEISIIVSYGITLQEIFVLEDDLFYDSGIDDALKNNNYVNSSSVTVTTDSTGTLLDIPTNGHSSKIGESTSTSKQFSSDIILELDVISSSKMQVRFRQSNDISRAVYLTNSETPSHYRFRVTNGLVYRSIDGGEETTYSFERTGNFEIWLQAREANASLKFKNLKVYSA